MWSVDTEPAQNSISNFKTNISSLLKLIICFFQEKNANDAAAPENGGNYYI